MSTETLAIDILVMAAEAGVAGALAMSIMQIAKEIFSLRERYLKYRFRAWLKDRLCELAKGEEKIDALSCTCNPPTILWSWDRPEGRVITCGACQTPFAQRRETPTYKAVTTSIFEIICNGDEQILFTQDVGELIDSLLSAAHYAIAFPTEQRPLLLALGVREADITELILIEQMQSQRWQSVQMQVKRRATMAVTACIEAFQRELAHGYKLGCRVTGAILSAMILGWWWWGSFFSADGGFEPDGLVSWLVFAVVGGLLAPVSKDLVKVIEGLRRKGAP